MRDDVVPAAGGFYVSSSQKPQLNPNILTWAGAWWAKLESCAQSCTPIEDELVSAGKDVAQVLS